MAENCTHDCSSCGENCSERDPKSFQEKPNAGAHIGKVIGIVSGKGGVGKSMMTSILASAAVRAGKKAGILDADITGPSIPRMFGIDGIQVLGSDAGLIPASTSTGINVMSINLLLENSGDPVIWRGPVIAGAVKQFWTDVVWGDLDYLFVDMPPGTGDVPLTVFQSLPVDGIIIVTSPQELVSMIVGKAVKMAKQMNIPVLGLVENMSYITCPDCGRKIHLFGESGASAAASEWGIEKTAVLPVMPELASLCDQGRIEDVPEEITDEIYSVIS
ncbi:MAG: Mrp/NBP35 family ATP-binding protein [Lachnospiraceae bacterium]|nr:Mrp/NBP35 family ATP-binding protein [Lachnospiraceae bacterium]